MSEPPGQRLGLVVDAARLDLGLSKQDLARIARVGRSTIADLINRGKVPGREVTCGRIEAALGWSVGSFEKVLGGAEPMLREDVSYPPSGSAKVLVEQLRQVAAEARAGAAAAAALTGRFGAIAELADSAAHLAARPR